MSSASILKLVLTVALIEISGIATAGVPGGGAITIHCSGDLYRNLPAVQDVGISSEEEIRTAADTQVAGMYRSYAGPSSLRTGTTFKIVYLDGTGETVLVTSTTSSMGATPIPGSQVQNANEGGGGGAAGGGSQSGSGSQGGGQVIIPVGGGSGTSHGWACVSTGSGPNVVWTCTYY